MKNLLLVLAIVVFATSCKKDELRDKGKLDPNAMISIWGKQTLKSTDLMTVKQVVKEATVISFFVTRWNDYGVRSFLDYQRDTINDRLLWFGTDVITSKGVLEPDFIEGKDFTIQKWTNVYYDNGEYNYTIKKIIGYIPNSVIRQAEMQIKTAFADSNFTECYKVFNDKFIFYPITEDEYELLKQQGLN